MIKEANISFIESMLQYHDAMKEKGRISEEIGGGLGQIKKHLEKRLIRLPCCLRNEIVH